MHEHHFICPYCWQNISMLLDKTNEVQSYIEDCEVCCNPIQVTTRFLNSELMEFQADNIEQ
ncbi:CPXCG motif-containing cysteine-rich protein [Yeosuana sp.]|uniref:CPXCG motif-containing cysteine-rich protein n=1 Tax=Yeosuana sp. TaxID=2529388 RepID=UPI004054A9A5